MFGMAYIYMQYTHIFFLHCYSNIMHIHAYINMVGCGWWGIETAIHNYFCWGKRRMRKEKGWQRRRRSHWNWWPQLQSLLKTISLNGFVRKWGTLKSTGESSYFCCFGVWPIFRHTFFCGETDTLDSAPNPCRGVVTGSHARPGFKAEKSWNRNLEPNPDHGTLKNLER